MISTDMPFWSVVESAGTLYEKDRDRFHLLLTAPPLITCELVGDSNQQNQHTHNSKIHIPNSPRILWLEISQYRVIMTMQGNHQLSYRHFWEQGVYGISRYWLPMESLEPHTPLRLRNFTKSLILQGDNLPENLRVEYELWGEKVRLGSYILNLEIKH